MTTPNIVSWSASDTHVVEVFGDLDVDSGRQLAREASQVIATGQLDLVLDLRGVGLLDSTGLAVLLNLKRRLTRRRGHLRLVCGPVVVRALQLTRLDEEFPSYRTVRAALAAHPTGRPRTAS
jgi:anti-sigma B factor antagonist